MRLGSASSSDTVSSSPRECSLSQIVTRAESAPTDVGPKEQRRNKMQFQRAHLKGGVPLLPVVIIALGRILFHAAVVNSSSATTWMGGALQDEQLATLPESMSQQLQSRELQSLMPSRRSPQGPTESESEYASPRQRNRQEASTSGGSVAPQQASNLYEAFRSHVEQQLAQARSESRTERGRPNRAERSPRENRQRFESRTRSSNPVEERTQRVRRGRAPSEARQTQGPRTQRRPETRQQDQIFSETQTLERRRRERERVERSVADAFLRQPHQRESTRQELKRREHRTQEGGSSNANTTERSRREALNHEASDFITNVLREAEALEDLAKLLKQLPHHVLEKQQLNSSAHRTRPGQQLSDPNAHERLDNLPSHQRHVQLPQGPQVVRNERRGGVSSMQATVAPKPAERQSPTQYPDSPVRRYARPSNQGESSTNRLVSLSQEPARESVRRSGSSGDSSSLSNVNHGGLSGVSSNSPSNSNRNATVNTLNQRRSRALVSSESIEFRAEQSAPTRDTMTNKTSQSIDDAALENGVKNNEPHVNLEQAPQVDETEGEVQTSSQLSSEMIDAALRGRIPQPSEWPIKIPDDSRAASVSNQSSHSRRLQVSQQVFGEAERNTVGAEEDDTGEPIDAGALPIHSPQDDGHDNILPPRLSENINLIRDVSKDSLAFHSLDETSDPERLLAAKGETLDEGAARGLGSPTRDLAGTRNRTNFRSTSAGAANDQHDEGGTYNVVQFETSSSRPAPSVKPLPWSGHSIVRASRSTSSSSGLTSDGSEYPNTPYRTYMHHANPFTSPYSTHSHLEDYGTRYSNRYYHDVPSQNAISWKEYVRRREEKKILERRSEEEANEPTYGVIHSPPSEVLGVIDLPRRSSYRPATTATVRRPTYTQSGRAVEVLPSTGTTRRSVTFTPYSSITAARSAGSTTVY